MPAKSSDISGTLNKWPEAIRPNLISFIGWMGEIDRHSGQHSAVGRQQTGTDVQKLYFFLVRKYFQQAIGFIDEYPAGMQGLLLPGKDRHQYDHGVGDFRVDTVIYRFDPFYYFGSRIHSGVFCLAGIICPDVDNDETRMEPVDLSVVQTPKDILCSVPTEAKIQYPVPTKQRIP